MNEFLCTDGKIDCIDSHGNYATGNGLITKHVGLSRNKKNALFASFSIPLVDNLASK